MISGLRATQELLFLLIAAADPDADASGEIVLGDERLDPSARVAIYANMYRARLLEVMREDFPATRAVLGDEFFDRAVGGYLLAHPSSHYSIAEFGRDFADYLPRDPLSGSFPWAGDLARLERALIDSFHAADAAPLSRDTMRAVAPAEWPALRMRTHPAARVLELGWGVADVRSASDQARDVPAPARAQRAILVWRFRNQCYYREIDRAERDGLKAAECGAAFSEICEAVAGDGENSDPAMEAGRLLDRWLRDEILVPD